MHFLTTFLSSAYAPMRSLAPNQISLCLSSSILNTFMDVISHIISSPHQPKPSISSPELLCAQGSFLSLFLCQGTCLNPPFSVLIMPVFLLNPPPFWFSSLLISIWRTGLSPPSSCFPILSCLVLFSCSKLVPSEHLWLRDGSCSKETLSICMCPRCSCCTLQA